MDKLHKAYPVHAAHCWQNEYVNCCKYGDDDCPATPDVWPHRTYDQDGNPVLVTQLGQYIQNGGVHAWLPRYGRVVSYAHELSPNGLRYMSYENMDHPAWAVDVQIYPEV